MTRDEARRIILKQAPDLADTVSNIIVLKLIDKIYDEFEKTIKELQDKYNTQQEVLKKLIVDSINKE